MPACASSAAAAASGASASTACVSGLSTAMWPISAMHSAWWARRNACFTRGYSPMPRTAASTKGSPSMRSGDSAISTSTSPPSLRRALSSIAVPIGRARGSRWKALRVTTWRSRRASGTRSSTRSCARAAAG